MQRGPPVTNRDIDKLRSLASQGVTLAQAARLVGITYQAAVYWNKRAHIGLSRRYTPPAHFADHPAPDIIAYWRLQQTMQRLTAWTRNP